jgi:hypothetical protein
MAQNTCCKTYLVLLHIAIGKGETAMSHTYDVEYTDTFGGEANYAWVRRHVVSVPELTHYGYDGSSNYRAANKIAERELMRRAKAAVGLTGVRGVKSSFGDGIEFRPYGMATVMFVTFRD